MYQAESNLSLSITHEISPIKFPVIDQSAFLPVKSNSKQSIAMISVFPAYQKNISIGIINGDPIYRLKEMKLQKLTTDVFFDYSFQTKKERFKIRIQSMDKSIYRANWSIDYNVSKKFRIQQKSILQGDNINLGGLISIGTFWNFNRFKFKTVAFAYETNQKPLYITRSAIQLPWELQIVSGSGLSIWWMFSRKFSRLSVQSSVEMQLKREIEAYLWQKPRIFVQITIP